MSDLIVKMVNIDDILPHGNADSLELAIIKGWQCVTSKGLYKKGDKCIYVPIDSVLPPYLISILFANSKIKLNNGRIRAIKIRGQISEGLIVNPKLVNLEHIPVGVDVAQQLNITKYEPKEDSDFESSIGKAKVATGNLNFTKYTDIQNIKHFNTAFIKGEPVVITEKIHGCLQANTRISLADGTRKTIKEIVENKLNIEVLGMTDSGQLIPTKIINWYENGISHNWRNITFTRNKMGRGNSYGSIICTHTHKFYCPERKQYVACSELKAGDTILCVRNDRAITYLQKEVLIGLMLGDGSLCSNSVSFGHKKEHRDYCIYILKLLGSLAGKEQSPTISGHGTEMVRFRSIADHLISELFENWVNTGKKQVPNTIQLNPISLAIWYMDDGSLCHHQDQEDRASFATCGFNEESIDNLLLSLLKIGIVGTKKKTDNKYWRIFLKSDEADKLFTLISPYIPKCMQYKIPKQYRQDVEYNPPLIEQEYKYNFVPQTILSIMPYEEPKANLKKYDLETETHNFIANYTVVHNSNWRAGYVLKTPKNFLHRIAIWLGLTDKYEFAYGSHNKTLDNKDLDVVPAPNVYAEMVQKYDLRKLIPKGVVIYGEVFGAGVQKGYSYGLKGHDLAIFDIKKDGHYLGKLEALNYAKHVLRLPTVPVIYDGPYIDMSHLKKLATGASIICMTQKIREGIVVASTYLPRKILKLISDDYSTNKNNTDFH